MFIAVAVVAVLLLLWIAAFPRIAEPLYNVFVFKPHKECGDPNELAALVEKHGGREVSHYKQRDGNQLHGWILGDPSASEKLILYSIGRDGDIARRARILDLLLQPGVAVFIYEYSGYGGSGGNPSLRQLCWDSEAAFDYACDHLAKAPEEIVLYGESFGGAISAWLLTRRNAQSLIIKSSFSSFVDICRELCFWIRIYPTAMFPLPRLNVLELLRSVRKPVLVIHGRGDRLARWSHALRLRDASRGQLLELPNSRHAFTPPEDEELLRAGVSQFLKDLGQAVETVQKV